MLLIKFYCTDNEKKTDSSFILNFSFTEMISCWGLKVQRGGVEGPMEGGERKGSLHGGA